MPTFRTMIVYDVIALSPEDAWHKVVRYQTDDLYHQSQHQALVPPEIVLKETATLKISETATPLERKNHGNGSSEVPR